MAQHFRNLLFATVDRRILSDLTTSEDARAQASGAGCEVRASRRCCASSRSSPRRSRTSRFSEQHRLLLELALLKAIEAARGRRAAARSRPAGSRPSQPPVRPACGPPKAAESAAAKPAADASGAERAAPRSLPRLASRNLPEFDRIRRSGTWSCSTSEDHKRVPLTRWRRGARPASARDGVARPPVQARRSETSFWRTRSRGKRQEDRPCNRRSSESSAWRMSGSSARSGQQAARACVRGRGGVRNAGR